jgi:hypothetical protein
MSSKFSRVPGRHRKPRVCITAATASPGHPPHTCPVPPRTCLISPQEFYIETGADQIMDLSACCIPFPVNQPVKAKCTTTGGTIQTYHTLPNCGPAQQTTYQATVPPGKYFILLQCTWLDGGKRDALATAHVTAAP